MRILASALIACALTITAAAQSAPAQQAKPVADTEKLSKELLEVDRTAYRVTQEKGLDGWMSFFDPNAVSIQKKPTVGKDAIRALYKTMYDRPEFVSMQWEPHAAVVFPSGDLGYTDGETLLAFQDSRGNKLVSRGHYVSAWRKESDGSWKIISDVSAPDPN